MLFESANQFQIFLFIFLCGILAGVVHTMFFAFRTFLNSKKVITFVCDFLFVCIFFFVYALSCHYLVLGEFRLYTICAFVLGFVVYLNTVEKMVAKFILWVYNIINKMWQKFKNTKTYKVIFK